MWRQISRLISLSCAVVSSFCSSGLRPRLPLTRPFLPLAAKRWQMSNTPVWLSPTWARLAKGSIQLRWMEGQGEGAIAA